MDRIRLRMISRAVNGAYRLVLKLAYPVLDALERTFGTRSNVAMVAVWYADKLLLIKHSYRHGEGLPGGTIGTFESPAEAAARELNEEVGICARPEDLIVVRSWRQWQGRAWLFEYRPATEPMVTPDQREVIAARFVALDNIPGSIKRMVAKRRQR